jgi:hypothetical protein
VGGCAPKDTTHGQNTVQEQFKINSPFMLQSVGVALRLIGLSNFAEIFDLVEILSDFPESAFAAIFIPLRVEFNAR